MLEVLRSWPIAWIGARRRVACGSAAPVTHPLPSRLPHGPILQHRRLHISRIQLPSRISVVPGWSRHVARLVHSAVVELVALPGSHIRYSTIQNWSSNVYNLVTKRGIAHEDAKIEWVDGNIGSKLTMKYPAVILKGEGSHAEVISVAYSGEGQHQDAGAKIHHLASNTTSKILSKSISKNGGRGTYRGMVTVSPKADNCKLNVVCDALILDEGSRSDTYPTMEVANPSARCEHEASVSKVSDDQLFYLMSRGHSEEESLAMIVNGFFEPFTRELPMEYAVELNQLMALEMEGSIG